MHWVFVAARKIFVVAWGLLSSCGTWSPGHVDSVVAAHGLSCPVACGILVPDQGLNPCPLHWKDS